ncbi:protein kinase domain-containing protein [Nonomuraea sp. bgisy101]|uniref:protein kinase domain-containing protein n=1 Tax=Nonomuraea sp. bgisy101 TaxID=3413784 RepID=UPI003D728892
MRPLIPEDPAAVGGHRILGRLGEGGQGIVFLGEGPGGQRVAVKVLQGYLTANAEARERFVREVRIATSVARFCTAQILATGVVGDSPYIVSEYVPGPSLEESVRDAGPRTGAALERLALNTAMALAAIHRAGVLHRDFKPANILLGPDGPVVIDFGIARALDGGLAGMTHQGQFFGTPRYMAPEQFAEAPVGPPADVFAWAMTMVFAANGRPAFITETLPGLLHSIMHEEPDLGVLAGGLRDLVALCLAKDPARRPTAEQLVAHLSGARTPVPPATQALPQVPPAPQPPPFLQQASPGSEPPSPVAHHTSPGPQPAATGLQQPPPSPGHPSPGHGHPSPGHQHAYPVDRQTGPVSPQAGPVAPPSPPVALHAPTAPPQAPPPVALHAPTIPPQAPPPVALQPPTIPPQAPPPGPPGQEGRPSKGNRRLLAVLAGATVVVLGAVTAGVLLSRDGSAPQAVERAQGDPQPSTLPVAVPSNPDPWSSPVPSGSPKPKAKKTRSPTPTPTAVPTPVRKARLTERNLLANGGFNGADLAPWYLRGTVKQVTSGQRSGWGALWMTSTSGMDAAAEQVTRLRPNTKYTLSGWVRSDGRRTVLGVKTADPHRGGWRAHSGKKYGYYSMTFTTGKDTTKATVFCWRKDAGQGYCDDVSLRAWQ